MLLAAAAIYLIFISIKFPRFLEMASGDDLVSSLSHSTSGDSLHRKLEDSDNSLVKIKKNEREYGRITWQIMKKRKNGTFDNLSELEEMADEAWILGATAWEELESYREEDGHQDTADVTVTARPESCPSSLSLSLEELASGGEHLMFLPCGLSAGSSITVIGTPHVAHPEYVPQLASIRGDAQVLVSQFMVELQGLKAVDGEDPPRIFHLNPRVRGDWSQRPVIEHNTCYRMQWGTAQRCDGLRSRDDDDTGT